MSHDELHLLAHQQLAESVENIGQRLAKLESRITTTLALMGGFIGICVTLAGAWVSR